MSVEFELREIVLKYGVYRRDGSLTYAEGNAMWETLCASVNRVCDERKRMIQVLGLVRPAMSSLMDEATGKGATKWGLVNDCLFAVAATLKAAGEA